MNKKYVKYLRFGHLIKSNWSENEYELVEWPESEQETVKAVAVENSRRYQLLSAWSLNWDKDSSFRERFGEDIEACRTERVGYVEELRVADITPINKVRFIDSHYGTKFEIQTLSTILVNGRPAKAVYIDPTHFRLIETDINTRMWGDTFHVCQFAELCEKSNIKVVPVI